MGCNLSPSENTAFSNTDCPRESMTVIFHKITCCKRVLETPTYFSITTIIPMAKIFNISIPMAQYPPLILTRDL
jgi:hypothetical protein